MSGATAMMLMAGAATCNKELVAQLLPRRLRRTNDDVTNGRELTLEDDVSIAFAGGEGGGDTTLVNFFDTVLVGRVVDEVVEPSAHRPSEGILRVRLDLPFGHRVYNEGAYGLNQLQETRATIQNCFTQSNAIDVEQLCIKAKKAVWKLTIDLQVLQHNGSVLEAAMVCAVATLMNFALPQVKFSSDGSRFVLMDKLKHPGVKLRLNHMPFFTTFLLLSADDQDIVGGEDIAVNLFEFCSDMEERNERLRISIAANERQEVCSVRLACGDVTVPPAIMMRCVKRSIKNAAVLGAVVRKAFSIAPRFDNFFGATVRPKSADKKNADNVENDVSKVKIEPMIKTTSQSAVPRFSYNGKDQTEGMKS